MVHVDRPITERLQTAPWAKLLARPARVSNKAVHDDGRATASAVAGIYAILGDKEQAVDWLEKAYEQSDDFLVFLNIQPQFENVRSEPRFRALIKKYSRARCHPENDVKALGKGLGSATKAPEWAARRGCQRLKTYVRWPGLRVGRRTGG